MAFTRRYLTALGIDAEKIDEIMNAHVEVVEALKAQISDSKDDADKLTKVQAELDKLKASQKDMAEKLSAAEKERDEIKGKFDTASADIEKLRTENTEREANEKSKKALETYLKDHKYSKTAIGIIVNKTDFHKSIEFGDDGKAKNLDTILQAIQADEDFSGFTPKETKAEHTPATPPANNGGTTKATWEDVDKIKDDGERQAFMAAHKDDLGI